MQTHNRLDLAPAKPPATAQRLALLLRNGSITTDDQLAVLAVAVARADGGRLPQRGHLWVALSWLTENEWVNVVRSPGSFRVGLTKPGRLEASRLRWSRPPAQ